nr:hypothetical protein [Bradyrhizobium sp. WSM3983]
MHHWGRVQSGRVAHHRIIDGMNIPAVKSGYEFTNTDAPRLSVVCKRNVNRLAQSCLPKALRLPRDDRVESLHVARPAAIGSPVFDNELEWIAQPFLSVGGHDIKMTRKDNSAWSIPKRREQISLSLAAVEIEPHVPTASFKMSSHPIDAFEI